MAPFPDGPRLAGIPGLGDEPPRPVAPMLATLVAQAFDSPDYLFEVKWDGMRAIACIGGGRVRLYSRSLADVTVSFPELLSLPGVLQGRRAILDGEVVSFVGALPSFARLQERMHVRDARRAEALARTAPVAYVAFDLLLLDDEGLCPEPLTARRALLDRVLGESETVRRCAVYDGEGVALFAACAKMGLEGIMAKRKASRYAPGRRTRDWLKVKTARTAEVVIGGWTEGAGARRSTFGALLLGVYQDGRLRYVGHTGTGLDGSTLQELLALLQPLETEGCPFTPCPRTNARPHWVQPALVCEVRFANLTPAGHLRAPVFLRLRPDRTAAEVDAESLEAAVPAV